MSALRFVVGSLSIGLMIFAARLVLAEDYPARPIRIITNQAGGGADFVSRLVAQGISGPLGQPVIVENRGALVNAMTAALKTLPDGYSLLVTGSGAWAFPLLRKAAFDVERDFMPITHISREVYVMVVNPALPVTSVKELIALAKTKPGQLNYGGGSAGTPQHLGLEMFKSMAGINVLYVSYAGPPMVVTGILGNEVQLTIADAGLVMPHVKSGKLKGLGVTSATPSALVPGMTTVAATVPGYEFTGATGIWAPAKTPAVIVNRLNREIVRVITVPENKERLLGMGSEVIASTPEQFAETIRADVIRSAKIIKEANIKVE